MLPATAYSVGHATDTLQNAAGPGASLAQPAGRMLASAELKNGETPAEA